MLLASPLWAADRPRSVPGTASWRSTGGGATSCTPGCRRWSRVRPRWPRGSLPRWKPTTSGGSSSQPVRPAALPLALPPFPRSPWSRRPPPCRPAALPPCCPALCSLPPAASWPPPALPSAAAPRRPQRRSGAAEDRAQRGAAQSSPSPADLTRQVSPGPPTPQPTVHTAVSRAGHDGGRPGGAGGGG